MCLKRYAYGVFWLSLFCLVLNREQGHIVIDCLILENEEEETNKKID